MGGTLEPFGTVAVKHTQPALTTASAIALAANPLAKYRLFQVPTTAAGNVYLGIGVTAVVSTGILLQPGQSYEMSLASKNLDTRVVNALVATGTVSLLVTEGL